MACKAKEFQSLQEQVIELERQLAETRAAIRALTALPEDGWQTSAVLQSEPHEQVKPDSENVIISEAGARHTMYVAPYPLMIWREDGRVVMVNAAWTKITGYTLEDIPTIDEWAHKAYGEGAAEQKTETLTEGFSQHDIKQWGEYEITTRSGEKRFWDFSTAPLGIDQNGRRLMVAMAVDITERKQTEEKLRAARDEATWLARFPGENPNPVIRVSATGIVLYCNPPAASLRGWRCAVDTMLSRPLLDLTELAVEQNQVVEQDILLGDKFYSVSAIPLLKQGYLNLYGRDITERRQAEKALEESEHRQREITRLLEADQARLAAILQHLPVGVWIADQTGRLIGSNEQVDRIWGGEVPLVNSPDEYRKYESWHPESGKLLEIDEFPLTVALRTGQPVEPLELKIRRFDGSEGTVLVSAAPIKDRRGGLTGAVGVNVDITERKQAEEALRASEQRLSRAQEIAHLGSWELDLINNRLTWSDEVYRIFGLEPQQFGATYEAFLESVHPDDRAAVDNAYSSSIREGRDMYEVEHRVVKHSNGEVRIVHEKCEHFRDQNGQIVRSMGMVHDITDRKKTEEELRKRETRYRTLFESIDEGFCIVEILFDDLDHPIDYRFLTINPAFVKHTGLQDAAGKRMRELVPLHEEYWFETYGRIARTGQSERFVNQARQLDGRWYDVYAFRVGQPDERKVAVLFTDITERRKAEEQLKDYAQRLERSNRELEQFAFIASHDLQEPLRKIEMFGGMLLERAAVLNDQERNYVDRMRNAASRMRDMVEGLLQLSRVTTQGKPFVSVDLSQVTSEVLHDLEGQIRRTGGKVNVEPMPTIEGDNLQLHQLLQNLIGNALKYHQPGTPPEVNVTAKQVSGKVQILIEDKGIGFAPEDTERVFQPFQRLVGRGQYEGSGMGLAICRRIVERHGGEISAFSQPGQGATFIVTLPNRHAQNSGNES